MRLTRHIDDYNSRLYGYVDSNRNIFVWIGLGTSPSRVYKSEVSLYVGEYLIQVDSSKRHGKT
jgi:hypothetical protein